MQHREDHRAGDAGDDTDRDREAKLAPDVALGLQTQLLILFSFFEANHLIRPPSSMLRVQFMFK